MKYPNTGLYHFCKELGRALIRQAKEQEDNLSFYVDKKNTIFFGAEQNYITQKAHHKIFANKLSGCNIWHSTFQGTQYLPLKRKGLKIISTIHDLNFLHEGKGLNKELKYLKRAQKLIDRADVLVTISEFVKNDVLNNLNVGNKPIKVIYNGCNKPSSTDYQAPNLDCSRPFFFTIGTITDKKNFHVLPAMLLGNDCELIIAGITQNEAYKNKIIATATSLGVEARVKFVGAVTESEKYWLMQHCLAFCFPSIAEGFGLPVIEAMQFGTQVILSKATSLPEIGGNLAIYFDDFEATSIKKIANCFLSTTTSNVRKQDIINWAAQFDWDETAKKYWEIYSSLT